MKNSLSACIIVHNEEKVIERCLKSLQGLADEIILVHDGDCVDKSLEIARKYGAKIFIKEFKGTPEPQRPFSFRQATGDWILQIDADEYFTKDSKDKIKTAIQDEDVDAYALRWPLYDGHIYPKGDLLHETKLILFRRSKMYYIATTNETPKTYGRINERQDITLEHKPTYNNYTFKRLFKKWYPWVDIQAREMVRWKKADTFNIPDVENSEFVRHYKRLIEHPYLRIVKNYILKDFIYNTTRLTFFKNPLIYTKVTILRYLKFLYLARRLNYHKRRLNKKLKIFIDWQPMTLPRSGVGFYIFNIAQGIAKIDSFNKYTLGAFSIRTRKIPYNIGKNFKTKVIFFPSSKYLQLIKMHILFPVEMFFGKHNIYFFGNFLYYPHIWGKAISVIHDLTYIRYPEFMEANNFSHLSKLVPYTIKKSTLLVTPSEATRKEIIEIYHIHPDKIITIYPVINFKSARGVGKVNISDKVILAHEIFDKIPTNKYILYLGNLEPRKNILRLVMAYKKLPARLRRQYALVIAGGKGWNYEKVLNEIEKPLVDGKVIYLGYIDETVKNDLYKNAIIFVYPSIYEGFGMPIIEAMDNDVPVITSNISCMTEIADDAAIYVDPFSIDDIKEKIEHALQDEKERILLKKKAAGRIEYFRSQKQSEKLLERFYTI